MTRPASPSPVNSPKHLHILCRWLTLFLPVFLGAGCALPDPDDVVLGPGFRPANVHVETRRLNPHLRRVAVLPLSSEVGGTPATDARESLETAFHSELKRTQRFETVWVGREDLQYLTGRADWAADDTLPPDFLKRLQEKYRCDAVLFVRLTRYEAYPPLAVGWQFKLVGCPTPQVLWAFDEVFDAREGAVVNSARRYQQSDRVPGKRPADSRIVLTSPRLFAAYTVHDALATLPPQ